MVSQEEWDREPFEDYDVTDDETFEEPSDPFFGVPLYDEDGNEIPDEELVWNIPDNDADSEDTSDWQDENDGNDGIDENTGNEIPVQDSRPADERRRRIAQSVREESLRRLELSARTLPEYQALVAWYDREEQSRMRKERRYEVLGGDTVIEYGILSENDSFPASHSRPTFRQITRGEFDDYLNNCPFTMHDLTDKAYIRKIVKGLKLDHKEILYFLGLRLYPTRTLAGLRGQTERNIRKVRDTVRKKLQRKLYRALVKRQEQHSILTIQERDFLKAYTKKGQTHENKEPV